MQKYIKKSNSTDIFPFNYRQKNIFLFTAYSPVVQSEKNEYLRVIVIF